MRKANKDAKDTSQTDAVREHFLERDGVGMMSFVYMMAGGKKWLKLNR